MRCAHPEEFVPQWPSDNNSVNHVRRKGQCGTDSEPGPLHRSWPRPVPLPRPKARNWTAKARRARSSLLGFPFVDFALLELW